MRLNVVQDAHANMSLARDHVTQEGYYLRRIVDLPLVRSKQPMFNLGWTMMHAMDDSSPLSRETAESLRESEASIVLIMSGTDESTGQSLTARTEYSHLDICWNATFCDILQEDSSGVLHIDYSKFDQVEPLPPA
jgi:inward rectifier potassium channel